MEAKQQPTSPTPLSTKLSLDEITKSIIHEMEKGKESLDIIRSISLQGSISKVDDHHGHDLLNDHDIHKVLERHSMVALNSYVASISMLRSCVFERELANKRKNDEIDSRDCDVKYEGSPIMEVPRDSVSGRGRYKRSRTGGARVQEVTQLTDDGFAWRKYGQKTILNATHPRNYYRCTHKHDQKCLATKQVQQISENPAKYMIIYHGNHTCNNIFKSNTMLMASPEEHPSTVVLSFDQSKQHNNPMMFPASAFPVAKQDEKNIKAETPSVSQDSYSVHSQQSSPSCDNFSNYSQDGTAITGVSMPYTPVSQQSDVISTAENYSPTSTQDEVVEDYSCIWADLDVFQDIIAY